VEEREQHIQAYVITQSCRYGRLLTTFQLLENVIVQVLEETQGFNYYPDYEISNTMENSDANNDDDNDEDDEITTLAFQFNDMGEESEEDNIALAIQVEETSEQEYDNNEEIMTEENNDNLETQSVANTENSSIEEENYYDNNLIQPPPNAPPQNVFNHPLPQPLQPQILDLPPPYEPQNMDNNNNGFQPQHWQQLIDGINQVIGRVGQPQAGRNITKIISIPKYKGGDQDPINWLTEFNEACDANGIDGEGKLRIIAAHLEGAPSSWFRRRQRQDGTVLNQWEPNDPNDADTVEHSFVEQFKQEYANTFRKAMWKTNLRNRKQKPGETVEKYLSALEDLWYKIDQEDVYPADDKLVNL